MPAKQTATKQPNGRRRRKPQRTKRVTSTTMNPPTAKKAGSKRKARPQPQNGRKPDVM